MALNSAMSRRLFTNWVAPFGPNGNGGTGTEVNPRQERGTGTCFTEKLS